MERKSALRILGLVLFVVGVVLAVVAFISYVGGDMFGPVASALRSYFVGPIAATLLIIVGGLILWVSAK